MSMSPGAKATMRRSSAQSSSPSSNMLRMSSVEDDEQEDEARVVGSASSMIMSSPLSKSLASPFTSSMTVVRTMRYMGTLRISSIEDEMVDDRDAEDDEDDEDDDEIAGCSCGRSSKPSGIVISNCCSSTLDSFNKNCSRVPESRHGS